MRGLEGPAELRFITYLSPGIPRAFFEAVVGRLEEALGLRASLLSEPRFSGPVRGVEDPFSRGEVDVGFMCAPAFFWLRRPEGSPVELLPAAPVFGDGRARGRPVYFSEVVVGRESPVRSFAGLRGRSWAYNDPCSLSGYLNLLKKLAGMGEDERFFGRVLCSGSHLDSMALVAGGGADAAAIDSNVLRIHLREKPELAERLRVIETWGPFPIQPVVVRSSLDVNLKTGLLAALLGIGASDAPPVPALSKFGLTRFAPVSYGHYASEERALRECEAVLLSGSGRTAPSVR